MATDHLQSAQTILDLIYPGIFTVMPIGMEKVVTTKAMKIAGGLLSSKEAAEYLGVSVATLRRMCEDRAVTFVRVTAREYKFELVELEAFKNARRYKRKSHVK
jgi:excisionase family DNA binding protein